EKSARYTIMSDIEPKQKIVYDKWIEILKPKIDRIYPQMDNAESRKNNIQKLAQENARYMTSVFTPTKMGHTINLRQLNHLISKFENYYEENKNSESPLMNKIAQSMKDFVDQTKERWFIEGLQN
ncbi:MAG: FAD-dependent thymidylate synthase, partial [Nanoarchaeota archaeon]